jgi:dephospho-CoA kinase
VLAEVWEKRLYVHREESVILHLRRTDSPWGRYTVWFRDWLRAHPAECARYEQTKRLLSERNVGKPDYDDYTRAKSAFFDDVQESFTSWACGRGRS